MVCLRHLDCDDRSDGVVSVLWFHRVDRGRVARVVVGVHDGVVVVPVGARAVLHEGGARR